jgi:hypothetical protein
MAQVGTFTALRSMAEVLAACTCCVVSTIGPESSIVVNPDTDDDSIVHVKNRGNEKLFEVDRVFRLTSTQNEVGLALIKCLGQQRGGLAFSAITSTNV